MPPANGTPSKPRRARTSSTRSRDAVSSSVRETRTRAIGRSRRRAASRSTDGVAGSTASASSIGRCARAKASRSGSAATSGTLTCCAPSIGSDVTLIPIGGATRPVRPPTETLGTSGSVVGGAAPLSRSDNALPNVLARPHPTRLRAREWRRVRLEGAVGPVPLVLQLEQVALEVGLQHLTARERHREVRESLDHRPVRAVDAGLGRDPLGNEPRRGPSGVVASYVAPTYARHGCSTQTPIRRYSNDRRALPSNVNERSPRSRLRR